MKAKTQRADKINSKKAFTKPPSDKAVDQEEKQPQGAALPDIDLKKFLGCGG